MAKDFFTLIIWAICGSICAHFAKKQGRSPRKWFFLGMLLGLLGLLLLFVLRYYEIWRLKRKGGKQKEESSLKTASTSAKNLSTNTAPHILWYYLDSQQQQQGPMSFNALERAWKEDRVFTSSWVWNEEFSDWKRFNEVFFSAEEIKG